MTLSRFAAALFAASLAAGAAQAASVLPTAIQPWSRPAAAGSNAVGYLTLANPGAADVLVGADSPLAERVEMHSSSMAGGVMRMAAEPGVPLPAHGQVTFGPNGRHLMFVGLKRSLKVGDKLPATLRFKSGARLKVAFAVTPGAPSATHHMPGMGGMR